MPLNVAERRQHGIVSEEFDLKIRSLLSQGSILFDVNVKMKICKCEKVIFDVLNVTFMKVVSYHS